MKAIVTGVMGQDGSFLADLLVSKGYEVHGVIRRYSSPNFVNIQHLVDRDAIHLHEGDLTDARSLLNIFELIRPDEIFNLGSMSHVGTSFGQPEVTVQSAGLGALRVFEAVRQTCPRARVYQASSSEMYGNVPPKDQTGLSEQDILQPASPYGAAKVLAHHLAHIYRTSYDMHISCGILFNHESERRGTNFVTRKITRGLARIKYGLQKNLSLGNLDAVRDWGYAPEYVDAMWRMVKQDEPGDYVVATGHGWTVHQFLREAMKHAGMDESYRDRILVDEAQKRPNDIEWLIGNPAKAKAAFGWQATILMPEIARRMVNHDLALAEAET